MKKQILLVALIAVTLFTACSQRSNSSYEGQWSQNGKDSVVHVNYYDNSGNYVDFYMNWLLFNSLYRNGGYGACYNYYHYHPSEFIGRSVRYSGYSYNNAPTYYKNTHTPGRTTTNTYVGSKNVSTPNRVIVRPNNNSSPSRISRPSTPTRSFSSPSRSFSSPSRRR